MNNSNEVPPVQKVLGFAPVRTPRLARACKSNEKGGAAEHVNFSPNRRKQRSAACKTVSNLRPQGRLVWRAHASQTKKEAQRNM